MIVSRGDAVVSADRVECSALSRWCLANPNEGNRMYDKCRSSKMDGLPVGRWDSRVFLRAMDHKTHWEINQQQTSFSRRKSVTAFLRRKISSCEEIVKIRVFLCLLVGELRDFV